MWNRELESGANTAAHSYLTFNNSSNLPSFREHNRNVGIIIAPFLGHGCKDQI